MSNEARKACFSEDRIYRYTLEIVWQEFDDPCLFQFIGLNPSTADEFKDDPTVKRCKEFARKWGADGIVMTNLFAFRGTDPNDMLKHRQPIGEVVDGVELNDLYLAAVKMRCLGRTVACWGNDGTHLYRAQKVKRLLGPMKALKMTKTGQPQHPLYLKGDLQPFIMPT